MKKKIWKWIAIIGIALFIFIIAASKIYCLEGIQIHKPTYMIAGDKENQVKYQISVKYGLIYPFETGLYLAYTQLSHWNLYDQSSPFKESNYEPEIFWQIDDLWFLDYMVISPYRHFSNGRDGEESRGLETGYVQLQMSFGEKVNIGINEKATWHYKFGNRNADYKRYKGYFQTELFVKLTGNGKYFDQEKLAISFEWTVKSYWYQIDFMTRLLTPKIRPKIYVQYYQGTGEFLENYKQKTKALRAGFIFTN